MEDFIGLACLALAGAIFVLAHSYYSKNGDRAFLSDFGAMMAACTITGLIGFGAAELVFGMSKSGGLNGWLELIGVIAGVVAVVVVTVKMMGRRGKIAA